jgi:hypothetical protein
MAKKQDDDIEKLKRNKRKRAKKAKIGWRGQILLIFSLFLSVVMFPTVMLILFAMLPTAAALLVDRMNNGSLAITVGAMNFAGATLYIFQLWEMGHTPNLAIQIASTPENVIVMYGAAAIGYMIDWAMGGITRTFMVEKGKMRLKEIEKTQADMVERWGKEVTGQIPLNSDGFPLEPEENATE